MKTVKLIALALLFFTSNTNHAQVAMNFNVGSPPAWAPVGYSEVAYYYLPDLQTYYDVKAKRFIYIKNGAWVKSKYLPQQYKNYNLYKGYKVVLKDYLGNKPYSHFHHHKAKYYKGYKGGHQETYRSASDKISKKTSHHKNNSTYKAKVGKKGS